MRCRCKVCYKGYRARCDKAAADARQRLIDERKAAAAKRSGRPPPAWPPGGTMTREQYLQERDAEVPRAAAPRGWLQRVGDAAGGQPIW